MCSCSGRTVRGEREWLWVVALLLAFSICPLEAQEKPEQMVRMVMHYKDGHLTLITQDKVTMIPPPGVKKGANEEPGLFSLQLLNGRDRVLSSYSIPDPTLSMMEYPDTRNPNKLKSAQVKHQEVVFVVFVPKAQAEVRVRFMRNSVDKKQNKGKSQPNVLGTFQLN